MNKTFKNIIAYLTDRGTWKQVYYLSRVKDPEEGRRPLTKKDIVPIILCLVLILLFVYFVVIFVTGLDHAFRYAKH